MGLTAWFFSSSIGLADDPPPGDKPDAVEERTPPSQASEGLSPEEVQERGIAPKVIRPGVLSPQILTPVPATPAAPLPISALPGHFAFQTFGMKYLTAVGGGGKITDVFHTDATAPSTWEQYRLFLVLGGGVPPKFAIQTSSSNFITAVDGGGRSSDVLHSDAKQVQSWETFTFGPDQYGWRNSIQTVNGHFITAVGAGGKTTDAVHSDAVKVGTWEEFYVWKCGDSGIGESIHHFRCAPNHTGLSSRGAAADASTRATMCSSLERSVC